MTVTEISTIRMLMGLLTAAERRRLFGIGLLLTISGFAEMMGVGVVFGYLAGLNAVTVDHASPLPYPFFWIQTWPLERLALTGGLLLLLIFLAKTWLIIKVQSIMLSYVFWLFQRFTMDIFKSYVNAPLHYHLSKSSGDIQRNINLQPLAMFHGGAKALAYLTANALAVLFLCVVLLSIDPVAFLVAAFALSAGSGLFYVLSRQKLAKLGKQRFVHQAGMLRYVGQIIGGIKEIRVAQSQTFFENRFASQLRGLAQADCGLATASQLPGLLNQVTLVVGVLAIVLLYITSGRSVPELLPTLAAFGVAGVRIMGMVSSMIFHAQQLHFEGPGIRAMRSLVDELKQITGQQLSPELTNVPPLTLDRQIELVSVSFYYPSAVAPALDQISLIIPRGAKIAVVGRSGSGKSTFGLILTGLLQPTSGVILVDDAPLVAPQTHWFKKIAYVPQSVFLTDDTIRANVTFGAEASDEAIWNVLEVAQMSEKVRSLSKGLDELIGEGGALLSGGERQRLGIARALYRCPELLILDESTSALDAVTERLLMDGIAKHFGTITLVTIAHRLSLVRRSDIIFHLEAGRIKEFGGFDELVSRSPEFRHLTAV